MIDIRNPLRFALVAGLAVVVSFGAQARAAGGSGEQVEFTDLFGSPIPVTEPRPDEVFTEEVEAFHQSGENAYEGDEAAVEEGRELFRQHCSSCHMPDATGGMGPSLVDDSSRHERVETDKGFFEIVYGGASGAMPAFGERLDQEEILKVMAFVESLPGE